MTKKQTLELVGAFVGALTVYGFIVFYLLVMTPQ
jgi:hypothetical protein